MSDERRVIFIAHGGGGVMTEAGQPLVVGRGWHAVGAGARLRRAHLRSTRQQDADHERSLERREAFAQIEQRYPDYVEADRWQECVEDARRSKVLSYAGSGLFAWLSVIP